MHPLIRQLRDEIVFPVTSANLRVRADQLRSRLQLYPTMLGGQAMLVVLLIWLMWDAVPHAALLAWGATAYLVYAADMTGWLLYRRQVNTVQECTRWHIAFTLFTAVGGLVWGSTALWLFPPDAAHQALLIMIIFGLAAASVTTNPSYPSSFYLYALSVVLPLLFRFMASGDPTQWAMAGILLIYLAVVLKAGGGLGKAFRIALQQRHENVALVEQLTEQKAYSEQMRQQAELASREKSRFLAVASHDLRQPLQALTLFSEALKDAAGDKDTRHLAGQIDKSVHALADMFNELLDLSRLDAGIMAPRMQHFALQPLLDRLYVNFIPLVQAKKLAFEIPAGDGMPGADGESGPVLYSDPFLVERILRNLISNAIRYTEKGKVSLHCRCSGRSLTFEVADTGIGIAPEVMPHIFEEYYQADNPHRDRRKGLGLGLAIVRRIEQLLGCRVEVESEPGKGSTFRFTVALGDAEQRAHPFAVTHSRHDLGGTAVALVEDDPDIRQMIAGLMVQWGCRVFAGDSPVDVLRAMDAGTIRPDLLVCDYRLPGELTAIGAIGQMRELWGHSLPAMVLTGDTAPEVLHEIQDSGAMLLHKPITPARLRSLMYLALHGAE